MLTGQIKQAEARLGSDLEIFEKNSKVHDLSVSTALASVFKEDYCEKKNQTKGKKSYQRP
jgi:hypothetical protein